MSCLLLEYQPPPQLRTPRAARTARRSFDKRASGLSHYLRPPVGDAQLNTHGQHGATDGRRDALATTSRSRGGRRAALTKDQRRASRDRERERDGPARHRRQRHQRREPGRRERRGRERARQGAERRAQPEPARGLHRRRAWRADAAVRPFAFSVYLSRIITDADVGLAARFARGSLWCARR